MTADRIPDHLISRYSFDYPEDLGIDTSPLHNHLTQHNYSLGPGVPTSRTSSAFSASFDGKTSAEIQHVEEFDSRELSFSFWVFVGEIGFQGFRPLISKGNANSSHLLIALWPESTRLRVKLMAKEDEGSVEMDSVSSLVLGRWNHIGLVMEGPFAQLHVNGLVDCSVHEDSGFDIGDHPIRIGKDPWSDGFVGYIDDLRIFKRSITKSERVSVHSLVFPGILPDFISIGCESCSFIEAFSICSKRPYHICSPMELELGGLTVARVMGWIDAYTSVQVWNSTSKENDYVLASSFCCHD